MNDPEKALYLKVYGLEYEAYLNQRLRIPELLHTEANSRYARECAADRAKEALDHARQMLSRAG